MQFTITLSALLASVGIASAWRLQTYSAAACCPNNDCAVNIDITGDGTVDCARFDYQTYVTSINVTDAAGLAINVFTQDGCNGDALHTTKVVSNPTCFNFDADLEWVWSYNVVTYNGP